MYVNFSPVVILSLQQDNHSKPLLNIDLLIVKTLSQAEARPYLFRSYVILFVLVN